MRDDDCVRFLQWALPRLDLRWGGFRKVRGQVCKRVARRMAELDLRSVGAYRERLEGDPDEWLLLDRMCRITISRFWRDRETFEALGRTVLPELTAAAAGRGDPSFDAWSCGCASGEEAHSLSILWHERLKPRFPEPRLRILATDVDLHLLVRAARAVYPRGTVDALPDDLAAAALEPFDGDLRVAAPYREPVLRVRHDVRSGVPGGPFHLILCRNLAFTYFEAQIQRTLARRLADALRPGGALILGSHERVPDGVDRLEPWIATESIYRRSDGAKQPGRTG